MAEILHHLGWDVWNPINNGKNYQPQLVSRISAINSSTFKLHLVQQLAASTQGILLNCWWCDQMSGLRHYPSL